MVQTCGISREPFPPLVGSLLTLKRSRKGRQATSVRMVVKASASRHSNTAPSVGVHAEQCGVVRSNICDHATLGAGLVWGWSGRGLGVVGG